MSWFVQAAYNLDLLLTLVCWAVVPAVIWLAVAPVIKNFRAYWD